MNTLACTSAPRALAKSSAPRAKSTSPRARPAPTEEQKAASAARRASIRSMFAKIAALPIEKRILLADTYGLRSAEEGRTFSPSNVLLLIMQLPTASVVGGFDQWRKAGRAVRKGSRALAIWVPIGTGYDRNGDPSGAADEVRFVLGNVFDISQTYDLAAGPEAEENTLAAPAAPILDNARLLSWGADPAALAAADAPPAEETTPEETPATPCEILPETAPIPANTRAAAQPDFSWTAPEETPAPAPAPSGTAFNLKPDTTRAAGDVPVVSVRVVDPRHYKGARGYCISIEYTTASGETCRSYVTSERVRDLPAALERDARHVAAGCVSVSAGMISHRFTM